MVYFSIRRCIVLLAGLFLQIYGLQAQSETKDSLERASGLRTRIDVASIANYLVSSKKGSQYELGLDYIRKSMLFSAEAGRASSVLEQPFRYTYQWAGFYGRLGAGYNVFKSGKDVLFVSGRYGFSYFKDQFETLTFRSRYWGMQQIGLPAHAQQAHWLEAQIGLQTQIIGPLFIGISVGLRAAMFVSKNQGIQPLWIPGYGRATEPVRPIFQYWLIFGLPNLGIFK